MSSVFAPSDKFLRANHLALVKDRFSHPVSDLAGSVVCDVRTGELFHYALRRLRQMPQDAIRLDPATVKAIRQSIGDSQKEFAKRLGVSVVTVSRWETGKNSIKLSCLARLRRLQFLFEEPLRKRQYGAPSVESTDPVEPVEP